MTDPQLKENPRGNDHGNDCKSNSETVQHVKPLTLCCWYLQWSRLYILCQLYLHLLSTRVYGVLTKLSLALRYLNIISDTKVTVMIILKPANCLNSRLHM